MLYAEPVAALKASIAPNVDGFSALRQTRRMDSNYQTHRSSLLSFKERARVRESP